MIALGLEAGMRPSRIVAYKEILRDSEEDFAAKWWRTLLRELVSVSVSKAVVPS